MHHLDTHHILHDAQHGFRKHRSTESRLFQLLTISHATSTMDYRQTPSSWTSRKYLAKFLTNCVLLERYALLRIYQRHNHGLAPTYTTTTPPARQSHDAIQNHTPTSPDSNRLLYHTIHSEQHSTLHPTLCLHTCIPKSNPSKHHQSMEHSVTCLNQQHNHPKTLNKRCHPY